MKIAEGCGILDCFDHITILPKVLSLTKELKPKVHMLGLKAQLQHMSSVLLHTTFYTKAFA